MKVANLLTLFLFLTISSQLPIYARAGGFDVPAGAVIYGVMPTVFGTGGFRSVTAKLDYLQKQGVDILWICPINETDDPSAISYSITDYYKIREDFGTEDDFREMVIEAHRHKMKVLIDFVPNHTSNRHPYFLDAESEGKTSRYYPFYDRDSQGNPTYYFGWDNLPNLNYSNMEVRTMMTDALKYWITNFQVDGYRLDAAWGPRQRAQDFWPKLEASLSAIKSNVLLLAEAGARDPYYFQNGFDLAYDWSETLGHWAWENIFENPQTAGAKLISALQASRHSPQQIARFLNNNDTGKRFISRFGPEMTRVAAVLQHSVPGVPIVYSGDDVGAEFDPYDDPAPISWSDPHKLRSHYKKLAELRERLPALHSGDFVLTSIQRNASGLAFFRSAESSELLVILNFGNKADFTIAVPERYRKRFAVSSLLDELSGQKKTRRPVSGQDTINVQMPARSALILRP